MGKKIILTEKPSVAMAFAKALKLHGGRGDGFIECGEYIITWCVGHLITLSYPEVYDQNLKIWKYDTLPFIPDEWKYEVLKGVKKQFDVVKKQFNRADVDTIYFAGDSAREGEYIGRLVLQMCGAKASKKVLKRVWIDSQTDEEILRGIKFAKPLSEYDNLAKSAYLRAKEDYLMGINFSRVMSLKYAKSLAQELKVDRMVLSIGRVMTCVLAMTVERELEIKNFVKIPFYKIIMHAAIDAGIDLEWKAVKGSFYFQSPELYNEKGFHKEGTAKTFISSLPNQGVLSEVVKKTEKKNPPMLFNLAELQNLCSKMFKISPDETLNIVQVLYEKKLITYPRTDARVLTTAVCKEIHKNISGIASGYMELSNISKYILDKQLYLGIEKTKYTNDAMVSDHYAIIPTGQGLGEISHLKLLEQDIYDVITRRFIAIFLPAAEYSHIQLEVSAGKEKFFTSVKVVKSKGYMGLYAPNSNTGDAQLYDVLNRLSKGTVVDVKGYELQMSETKPPNRYNSGAMILAMENAGQLIDDEALRAQIKGSGIGTSATRAETLKKLVKIGYINLNTKTQILTPAKTGYAVYAAVKASMPQLLSPKLTASWEKGLDGVAEGRIQEEEYWKKLKKFIEDRTTSVKIASNEIQVKNYFENISK